MAENSFWIMRPFNTLWLIVFGAFLLLLIIVSLILRGKDQQVKTGVLVGACLFTLAGFIVYKYYLGQDKAYDVITASMGGFNWWGELPLQLCNINMILIPIAVLRKSRPLMSFCFFLGPLGAMMALVMPGNGFDGYSLLLPRMLGYYGTHFMIVIEGLAIVTFGLFRPTLRDLPNTILAALLIAFGVFVINMLLPKKERNAMGAAIGTTALNSAMTPAAVAEADPTYTEMVPMATAQCATASIITLFLCPFITASFDKYMMKNQKGIYSPEGWAYEEGQKLTAK